MAYTGLLLFLAIRAQERGQRVWQTSVREDTLFYAEAKTSGTPGQLPTLPATVPQSESYPPAPAPGAFQV